MARTSGSTIQDELYSAADDPAREELDDSRLLDLDAEKESPFLRAQKRVPARRAPLPKKTARRLLWFLLIITFASVGAFGAASLYHYAEHSWRFRLESSDNIELVGLANVTRAQIMEVMGGDIGRNIFFIPLDHRQKQLEQIPWVESVVVMRFVPDRIRIQIHERVPVAFARIGSKIMLVDATGALMDLSTKKKYSFPVILGMSSTEPLSMRAARMKIYTVLVRELDSSGGHYSQDLSEVDLSDAEDVKVLANDPEGEVLVHLGSSEYLSRFKIYVAHLREWHQQFQKLESVDLRYEHQIIVNPDLGGTAKHAAAAAKAVLSAGVKPTALVSYGPKKAPSHTVVHPAVVKHSTPASRWHKPALRGSAHAGGAGAASNERASASPARSSAARQSAVSKPAPKSSTVPQKPSPAILKGQDSR
jgi:cell division protein FtsQ